MQRLARGWSSLDRPYRFNVASVALAALLLEPATGGDTSPKQQVANQAPATTARATTTSTLARHHDVERLDVHVDDR